MNNTKARFWGIFTAFMALLIATILIMNAVPLVGAESKEVEDKADFDETSGTVTDVAAAPAPPSGSGVSVYLENGASGTLELDRFSTVDIDLQYYATAINYELVVTLRDSEDSANEVEIKFWISDASGKTVNADVDDAWGSSESGSATKTTARTSAWLKINIKIAETPASTDGTRKNINVDFDSEELVEDWDLDAGGTTDVKERAWDEIEFKAQDSTDDIYVDEIDVDTDVPSGYGYNWIAWGTAIIGTYAVLGIVTGKLPPFGHKAFKWGRIKRFS